MPGYVKQEAVVYSDEVRTVVFSCVGDSANGSIPDTEMTDETYRVIQGMFLKSVECIPGSPAPTVDSDVTILDKAGYDILGGNGANLLHNLSPLMAVPNTGGSLESVPVHGKLSISVDNQAVASAQYKIILIFSCKL